MNRRLLFPLVLSAVLHAAAIAAVLVSRSIEGERAAFTIDVAWSEAAAFERASSSPTGRGPEAALVAPSHAEAASAAPILTMQAASPDDVVESVQADAAVAAASPVPARDATETARPLRRRQVVAVRPVESKSTDSPLQPDPSPLAAAAPAQSVSPGARDAGNSLAGAPESSAPGRSGSAAQGGEAVHRVEPAYPMAARRRGLEGSVVLRVRFDAEGRPEEVAVKIGSGSEMLDDAAREAVKRWRFRGGIAGFVDVPITFRLRGTEPVQVTDAGAGRDQ